MLKLPFCHRHSLVFLKWTSLSHKVCYESLWNYLSDYLPPSKNHPLKMEEVGHFFILFHVQSLAYVCNINVRTISIEEWKIFCCGRIPQYCRRLSGPLYQVDDHSLHPPHCPSRLWQLQLQMLWMPLWKHRWSCLEPLFRHNFKGPLNASFSVCLFPQNSSEWKVDEAHGFK